MSDLTFADAANGFLFGPALLASHDGGRSWTRRPLPPVTALGVGARYAYALTQTRGGVAGLWATTIGSDRWNRLLLPTAIRPSAMRNQPLGLAVEGASVVLLQRGFTGPRVAGEHEPVGRVWVSGNFGRSWRSRPVPCTFADGGAEVIGIARAHSDSWLVDCFDNRQSSQAQHTQHHLYRTNNAGGSWVRLADPARSNVPALLADNGDGHAFLATEGGGGDALVGSFDGGRHWQRLLSSGGIFFGWADLAFLTATTGFVVGPTHYLTEQLYRTDDGGRTWRRLRIS